MTERFLVFGGSDYYPVGGWKDLVGQAATFADAVVLALSASGGGYRWAHVVDTETASICWDSTKEVIGDE